MANLNLCLSGGNNIGKGTVGQISGSWRASEAQKLAGAIPSARPSGTTSMQGLILPTPWILPSIGSRFTPAQARPANSPQTYHADEVDAQEDLASGLEGTAAGFPTVELSSAAGQHKKAANDGNCARVHTNLSRGEGTPVSNCSCHISPGCPKHRTAHVYVFLSI